MNLYNIFSTHPVITTDTRDCPAGSIFFALRGETFDGNQFAAQALANGCAHAVVDDASVVPAGDERYILVDDVLTALQQLAREHRRHLKTPIVQITGTNGKTTTKELTAAVLSTRHNVLYTQGNFNNHIGVPKTLLRLTPEHDIAVVETGANHPGEIALLSSIVEADCGLITNVGRAHLEGFGSFEGVIRTKGELYDSLRARGGFIFLDADNEHLAPIAQGLRAETYGHMGEGCDVEGEVVECAPFLKFRFRYAGGELHEVQTHLIGDYNVTNCLAAIAVGRHFNVRAEEAAAAIAAYEPTNNRSEMVRTEHNTLIVDAYNANPTSMAAALSNFGHISAAHKMLILGEMRELGADSAAEHARVFELAAACGADERWFVGEAFRPMADGSEEGVRWFPNVDAVKQLLADGGRPNDRLILVKGSNGTKLFQLPTML